MTDYMMGHKSYNIFTDLLNFHREFRVIFLVFSAGIYNKHARGSDVRCQLNNTCVLWVNSLLLSFKSQLQSSDTCTHLFHVHFLPVWGCRLTSHLGINCINYHNLDPLHLDFWSDVSCWMKVDTYKQSRTFMAGQRVLTGETHTLLVH